MPIKTIKAKFSGGVIKPLEEVNIPEGREITVTIVEEVITPARRNFAEALKATAGGWKDMVDAEALKRNIYDDRLIRSRPEVRL